MVDPGVPLGPGLLATWVPLQGPHTKNANARINTATIAANFWPLTLPSRSLFRMQSPVLVVHTLLHATELGLNKKPCSGKHAAILTRRLLWLGQRRADAGRLCGPHAGLKGGGRVLPLARVPGTD